MLEYYHINHKYKQTINIYPFKNVFSEWGRAAWHASQSLMLCGYITFVPLKATWPTTQSYMQHKLPWQLGPTEGFDERRTFSDTKINESNYTYLSCANSISSTSKFDSSIIPVSPQLFSPGVRKPIFKLWARQGTSAMGLILKYHLYISPVSTFK